MMLTDEQCDEFRRLPLSFNGMVREIYKAGYEARDGADRPLPEPPITTVMVLNEVGQLTATHLTKPLYTAEQLREYARAGKEKNHD